MCCVDVRAFVFMSACVRACVRAALKDELEAKRQAVIKREAHRAWSKSMWDTWRGEGKSFEYDVDVTEEEAKKHGCAARII